MPPRQAAGGIIVNSDKKVLLVNQHNNSWSFPKGGIEEGETPLEGAKREIREEAGITELELITELGSFERYSLGADGKTEDIPYGMSKRTFFLFRTGQPGHPDNKETTEVKWVTADEALTMLTHPKDKEFFASKRKEVEDALK